MKRLKLSTHPYSLIAAFLNGYGSWIQVSRIANWLHHTAMPVRYSWQSRGPKFTCAITSAPQASIEQPSPMGRQFQRMYEQSTKFAYFQRYRFGSEWRSYSSKWALVPNKSQIAAADRHPTRGLPAAELKRQSFVAFALRRGRMPVPARVRGPCVRGRIPCPEGCRRDGACRCRAVLWPRHGLPWRPSSAVCQRHCRG